MSKDRQETAEWAPGSACEKCGIPFFWNVKEMWSQKTVGVRQVRPSDFFSLIGASIQAFTLSFTPLHSTLHLVLCSTTAGNVGGLSAGTVRTVSLHILLWGLRSLCACAQTATRKSPQTSELSLPADSAAVTHGAGPDMCTHLPQSHSPCQLHSLPTNDYMDAHGPASRSLAHSGLQQNHHREDPSKHANHTWMCII